MKSCVIGGTGFIGTPLVRNLVSTGRDVVVIGRSDPSDVDLPEKVTYLQGSIGDKAFITSALDGVEEIVDLVHSSVPKTSYEDPVQDITNNLPASVVLFDVASRLPLKKVLLLSSGGAVYGEPQSVPIPENHPLNPISPYGITKLALEKYAYMYYRTLSLPVVCARPSNPYGIGQKPFTGQGFIATSIASVLMGKEISIFGEHGTIRDYIYISDVVNALLALLDRGVPGECYNIGSSVGRTNLEVIEKIGELARKYGVQEIINHKEKRTFDVSVNVLDTRKITEATGWSPRVDFDEGIDISLEWYHAHI